MRPYLAPALLALSCAPAIGQNSVLFTGRFPFVSLDAPNERTGGSVTQLEEFDISIVTPAAGAFARSWIPSTAHHAFQGDPLGNGNYTFFRGFKTYFQRINFAGPFVKDADRANPDPSKVYWTIRDDNSGLQISVRTNNGSQTAVIAPGDFFRWDCNGNVEFFITQAQIMAAAGPQTGSWRDGASAICQDSMGNLYYSPAEGGHWVNGNQGGPVFCNDGSIVMIDAANITYDASGNVASVVPSSARVLFEEVGSGPNPAGISVRGMVGASGLQDRMGAPVGTWANTVGLDLDPNGGTIVPAYPDINGMSNPVPNFVFCTDSGAYGGAILSTSGGGSVAVINGVQMGSNTPGVPSDGSYLGVQLDIGNFQPTLMGLAVVGTPAADPFVLDMPDWGAVLDNTQQTTFDIDGNTTPVTAVFLVAQLGPNTPGSGAGCILAANSPFAGLFAAGSFPYLFPFLTPQTLAILVSDTNGYVHYSVPNFHNGAFTGATMVVQGASVQGTQFQLSNPVLTQLK